MCTHFESHGHEALRLLQKWPGCRHSKQSSLENLGYPFAHGHGDAKSFSCVLSHLVGPVERKLPARHPKALPNDSFVSCTHTAGDLHHALTCNAGSFIMFQHSKLQHCATKNNISRLLDQVSEAKKVEEVLPCPSVRLWAIDAQESVTSSPMLSGVAHKVGLQFKFQQAFARITLRSK